MRIERKCSLMVPVSESQSTYLPPRMNWDPPPPLLQGSVLPPGTKGVGVHTTHSPARKGEAQFGRLERKLSALSTLWSE
jgi:hypothetical protein